MPSQLFRVPQGSQLNNLCPFLPASPIPFGL
jgi:hypothetical protein